MIKLKKASKLNRFNICKKNSSTKGYTLLEIMMVLVIIVAFFVIFAALYGRVNRSATASTAADNIMRIVAAAHEWQRIKGQANYEGISDTELCGIDSINDLCGETTSTSEGKTTVSNTIYGPWGSTYTVSPTTNKGQIIIKSVGGSIESTDWDRIVGALSQAYVSVSDKSITFN